MLHPYSFRELPKEHINELLKDAELNNMLKGKGAKRGNRFGLVKSLVGKVEDLLVSTIVLVNERHIPLLGGRFKEA